jgi:predicted MPP superfamily phosphohydrolase
MAKVSEKNTLTVGELIEQLSQFDKNAPIYMVKDYHKGNVLYDNCSVLERYMLPHDVDEHDFEFEKSYHHYEDYRRKNCIVLAPQSEHNDLKKRFDVSTEHEKFSKWYYQESGYMAGDIDTDILDDSHKKELEELEKKDKNLSSKSIQKENFAEHMSYTTCWPWSYKKFM